MKKLAVLACLMGLLGAIPAQAAELKDVFDRDVPVGKGRPTLVLYANRGSRDELRQHAYSFIYDLRAEKPIVLIHVDLRDVPGLFKGMARREIKKSHRESIEHMKNVFLQHGEAPPPELESSLYMVADANGQPHQSMGLKKGFDHVVAQVLSPSGHEVARGPFPESAGRLGQSMASNSERLSTLRIVDMAR